MEAVLALFTVLSSGMRFNKVRFDGGGSGVHAFLRAECCVCHGIGRVDAGHDAAWTACGQF